jgi:hypothetical protein
MSASTTAVRVQPAFADPATVRSSVEAAGPFWTLASYARSPAEQRASGAAGVGDEISFVPPWFRLDFALGGEVLVDGGDHILHNPAFAEAARAVYAPWIGNDLLIEPTTVYVNLMAPTAFAFIPHIDVPQFNGFTRADHPVWLLHQMMASGLFESRRVRLATAVSWFHLGSGGDFHYWPNGPDAASAVERAPFDNVAVVADNERTFHGVAPLGDPSEMLTDLTLDATMRRLDGNWSVIDHGGTVASYPDLEVRTTVSWKAEVFRDSTERANAASPERALAIDEVVDTFLADLSERGIAAVAPSDPHTDAAWIDTLSTAYPEPSPTLS